MKTLTFTIQAPRHAEQTLDILSERILVGSGAHCDIRLPLEGAQWEHVVITQEEGRVMARVASGGQMSLDGETQREGELREGGTLRVDATTIVLTRIAVEATTKQSSSAGPFTAGVAALLLMAAALFALKTVTARTGDVAPPAPDPIEASAATCPERQAAIPLAHEKLALARAKRERFRFYPHDGVEGVRYFRVAAACFDAGKGRYDADAAREEANTLEIEVRDAFHSSRVRLERALVRRDARTALAEVKLQRELLSERTDAEAYSRWLALLQSKLEGLASKESV